jgi:hypothetical protein
MGKFHDYGHTDPSIRYEAFKHSAHPKLSAEAFKEQGLDKLLLRMGVSQEGIDKAIATIATHADVNLDWTPANRMQSAFRAADSLSVFAEEKLPELFKEIPNGRSFLLEPTAQ